MAPDFTLPSTVGDKLTLSDYRGKKSVVLLFYPLDFSPVCSDETKAVRRDAPDQGLGRRRGPRHLRRLALGAQGLRRAAGHRVPALADFHPKGAVAEKYGVYLADKGISARTAFIIGKDGKIKEIVGSDIPVARDIAGLLDEGPRRVAGNLDRRRIREGPA